MNIDDLLRPISAEAPCGEDISFAPELDAIQELRREDDPTLDQGAWVTANKVADWPGVASACAALLATRSKDLRVAGWWADAAARADGLAGLAAGLNLVAALVESQWQALHPRIEDGDAEPRIGNLHWLLARVVVLCRIAPVTPPVQGRRLSLADVEAALARQQAIVQGTLDPLQAKAERQLLPDEVQRAVAAAGAPWLEATLVQARAVNAALLRLQQAVDARLGAEGPGFAAARTAAESCVDAVVRLGRDSGLVEGRPAHGADDGSAQPQPDLPVATARPGPAAALHTRAQALQQLREVAHFFRRTEPHSPVAYLADKAARWGDMPLHTWLRAVVKDGGSLAHLEELLGVEAPADGPSTD